MSTRKTELEQAVRDAFQPFTVKFEYPGRYLRDGIGFAVFDSEGCEIYREPIWTFSAAGAEAWIEAARREFISRGNPLGEWIKPTWMSEVLKPGDEMNEDEDTEV